MEQRLKMGHKWRDLDFVFTTSHGTPLDTRNVTRYFQGALKRAGLPKRRFHDLRHGYATLMFEAGVDMATISKSLGHSNLATTVDIYSHLTTEMQEETAAKMAKIMTG